MPRPAPIQTSDAWALAMTASPVVRRLASQIGRDFDDLVQVGLLAAHCAALRYDPERGPFVPYAIWYVRGAMWRHVHEACRLELDAGMDDQAREPGHLGEWMALVDTLPVVQREVVTLRLLGHGWEEAARIAGVSESTLRRRMATAVATLRALR